MYVLYISIQMCIYRHIYEYEPAYADGDDLEHICLKMYTHEPIHAHTRISVYSHIYTHEPISTHTHTRTCIPIYIRTWRCTSRVEDLEHSMHAILRRAAV